MMERSKRPALALPTLSVKVEAPPKQRRKLQKVPKVQNLQAKRAVSAEEQQSDSSTKSTSKKDIKSNTTSKPSLPLPALDLSDPVWSDFLRPSSGYHSVTETIPRPSTESNRSAPTPSKLIPEFAHLNVNGEKRRSSTDTLVADSPRNSTSTLRRQAKTPILRIGQLEAQARARNMARFAGTPLKQETKVVSQPREEERKDVNRPRKEDRRSSAEAIAEQYRALLASGASVYEDSHLKPEPLRPEERRRAIEIPETRGLGIQGRHTPPHSPENSEEEQPPRSATLELISRSPTSSDDGTLYSYQEATVYFKPVSFSPESKYSSTIIDDFPMSSPSLSPDKLSLQICVDLLARDLGSAVSKRPRRTSREETALQVWMMIEAYERLREQILNSGLRYEEVLSLEVMFDTWLKALYRMHGSMSGSDTTSVSDYDELERATEGVQLD